MTPPSAIVTKFSQFFRGADFKGESVNFLIGSGARFSNEFGVGILLLYNSTSKMLSINDVYYNGDLNKTYVTVFVYAR